MVQYIEDPALTEECMGIAKILVPTTGSKRDETAIRTAFAAARPFNAHVQVLFVHADPRETIPYLGAPLSPDLLQDLVEGATEIAKAASKSARGALAVAAGDAKVRIIAAPERGDEVTASYSELTGYLPNVLADAVLLSDLVVFPPVGHGDNPEVHEGLVRMLTKSGKPILLSPEIVPVALGRKIAVGWDGGPAAAHALCAAIPYLKRAQSVQIFSFGRIHRTQADADAAKSYIALHGIEANLNIFDEAQRPVGDLLVSAAADCGCDLLVIGGYGHSRLLEAMFGGATQRIVSQPKLPVFMMH
jgi:nucleotide-binding universal stress UspA family protein